MGFRAKAPKTGEAAPGLLKCKLPANKISKSEGGNEPPFAFFYLSLGETSKTSHFSAFLRRFMRFF
jgi:hypothetical protein